MSYEIVDHVPGYSDEQVAEMVRQAEEGYDVTHAARVPNPYFDLHELSPELLAAVDARAEQEGRSPALVIRDALKAYVDQE